MLGRESWETKWISKVFLINRYNRNFRYKLINPYENRNLL
jgi:hypothetical protein